MSSLRKKVKTGIAIYLLLLLLHIPNSGAQESGVEQSQQSPPLTKSGKTVKQPPPPLFHKHRGVYKSSSGGEVLDATPQSPPLVVDDPGVPDKGQYEINLTTQADYSKQQQTFDFLFVDANYGVVPKILGHELPTQVKFEFPLSGAKTNGDHLQVGIGTAAFGLKFNFYDNEHTGLSLAFYPQIEFAITGATAVERNLAEVGQTLALPLLVKKEFRYFTLVANGAVNESFGDPDRNTTGALGVGLGRDISRYTAVMAEIHGESAFDFKRERLVVVNFGAMRRLQDNVILYANIGHSLVSDEVPGHLYVGAGVKFLLTPKGSHPDKKQFAGAVH